MRSEVAKRILKDTPEDIKIFAKLYGDLLVKINSIIIEKGYTQKLLAEKMDKKQSEISKWLGGDHNFTLRSIAKLQSELGETLLEVPNINKQKVFNTLTGRNTFTYTVNPINKREGLKDWKKDISINELNNFGNVG